MTFVQRDSWRVVCALALASVAACSSPDPQPQPAVRETASAARETAPPEPATDVSTRGARPRIVVLGDSLTAGLGVAVSEAYPARLQERIAAARLPFEVVNAGVSGDTSAGGLSRMNWALEGDVRILIVALGGNDGLRGIPVDELQRNLAAIIERAQARGIAVVLAGMEAPPNFGIDYTQSFRRVYADLARQYDVALVPFLLDGVAGQAAMNQRDGIHPTAEGAQRVADNVWPVLGPLAERAARGPHQERRPGS
jgi:acyl-CoA thioesterase-1